VVSAADPLRSLIHIYTFKLELILFIEHNALQATEGFSCARCCSYSWAANTFLLIYPII
jgi:hypothetical protein